MSIADFAQALVGFARENPDWIALIVFTISFFEFIPLVWTVLIGVAALVGPADPVRLWVAVIAAAVGGAAGDGLLYWLGRAHHARVNAMWPIKLRPQLLEKSRSFFQRWGVWAVVFGRFSGPVRAGVPLVAGVLHMPYTIFQLATFVSALAWSIAFFWPTAWAADWLFTLFN